MDVELKPCPFCGGEAVQMVSGSPGCHYVRCEGCGATSNDCSRERTTALWNRRDESHTRAAVEAERAAWHEAAMSISCGGETCNQTKLKDGTCVHELSGLCNHVNALEVIAARKAQP